MIKNALVLFQKICPWSILMKILDFETKTGSGFDILLYAKLINHQRRHTTN